VERKWRKLKYSVNSETSLREDKDEDKANYNVKLEQLATHKSKSENKKNVNTKISVPRHQQSTEPQLTASETDNYNSNNKEASNITANHGKSIIPARSNFKTNSNYGSLNYTDSTKELGSLDNIFKNTYFRTRTYVNVKNNKINPIDLILNPITYPNLIKYQPTVINKNQQEPKPKAGYRQNQLMIKAEAMAVTRFSLTCKCRKLRQKLC